MTPKIYEWIRQNRSLIPHPGRVLEVGSFNVNGTARDHFLDATEYIGIDQEAGPSVDIVMNAHNLVRHFGVEAFDTVISCECLEHDPIFWDTVSQMHRVLKPGGFLLVTNPSFGFPVHRYPKDYWRFHEDSYREIIFEDMDILALSVGDVRIDNLSLNSIMAIGKKGD